jgi:hypothetical protein
MKIIICNTKLTKVDLESGWSDNSPFPCSLSLLAMGAEARWRNH